MSDSVYRQTFLANEDWKDIQHNYSLNFMQNQVLFKEAQKAIASTGDKNQLTLEQQVKLVNKLNRKKAMQKAN